MRKLRKVVPFGLAVMMSLQGIYPAVPVMADTVKVATAKKTTSSATVLNKKERAKIMQQINAMSPEEGLKLAKKKGLIKEDTNAKESNLKKATVNKDAKEGEVGYQFTQDQYVDETHRIRYEYTVTAEGEVSAQYVKGIVYEDGNPKKENNKEVTYDITDELTYPSQVTLNNTTYKVTDAATLNVKAKHLIIPEGVETCWDSSTDQYVEKMTIPSTLKKFDRSFYGHSSYDNDKSELEWKKSYVFKGYELSNPEKAKYISVRDGIVYNKEETEMVSAAPCALEKDVLTLPDTLKEIPAGSFKACKGIKKLVFGKNITSIGNGAFAYSNIENVQMNDNVTALDEYAFYYCTKLANVDLSKSLTKIDGYETFKYTAALKHIDLKNVKELTGWYTFQQSGLEDVDLSNVSNLAGVQQFVYCRDLRNVYIGKDTDFTNDVGMGVNLFYGCTALENYVEKEKNQHHLYVENGRLYASEMKGSFKTENDGDFVDKLYKGKILVGYSIKQQINDVKNGTLKIDDDITGIAMGGAPVSSDLKKGTNNLKDVNTYFSKLTIPSSVEVIDTINTLPVSNLEIDFYGNEVPTIGSIVSQTQYGAEEDSAVLGTKTLNFKTDALKEKYDKSWKYQTLNVYMNEKIILAVLPQKNTTSITLNRTSDTFKCEGESQEIHLIAKLSSDDCTDVVKFKSSNKNVATVDGNGVVKTIAGAHGTAVITATAGDYSASYKVTVKGSGFHATGLDGSDLGSFKWDDEHGKNQLNLSDVHIYCNDCNKGLEKGTDYTVSYENTDKPGKAKVTFTGINGYEGYSLSYTYTILPNSFTIDESLPACRWKGTGKEHKVDLTGKVTHWNPYKGEKTTLVEGKDYRLEYSDNTKIGTAKVKVIGLGDYEGYEKILSFEIKAPHGWNGFQVNYNGDVYKDGDDLGSFDWTGNDVEPKFEVTCNHCGDTLVNGTDYYLEYSNDHRNPGKVTVKVVGFGDYKGWTQSFTYTIKNKTFSYSGYENGSHLGTVEYTGKEATYTISEYDLKDANGESLTEGTDYKVTYSNNIDPGTANIKITGLGDYEGCNLNFTYTIDHAYFMYNGYGVNNDGADLGPVAYTGKATEYEISDVYDNNDWNNKLIEGKDYKLVYSDNTKPGTAKVEIIGLGIYTGCDLTFTYTIVDHDGESGFHNNLYTDGADMGSYAYTGEEVKPSIGLMYSNYNQTFLIEGVDYKVEYSNNINPGTATAKVIGIGRYAGHEMSFTYTIKNKSFAAKDHKDGENLGTLKWTGKAQTMKLGDMIDPIDGHVLKEGTDYKIVYSDNVDAGTAKAEVIGSGYYEGSSLTFYYTIEKQHGWNGFYSKGHKDGESLGTFKWTGNTVLIDPDMRCSHCDKELQENVDYKIEYSNNIDPGVASMKIIGMGDYKGYELNFTFVIEKKTPTTTEDQKPTTTTTETKPTTGTTESSSATSETKPTTGTTAATTTTTESKPTTEDKTTATTESKPTTSSTTTETKPATTETRPSTEDSSTVGTTAAKKETATTAAPVIRISVKKAAIQKIKALKKAFTINILKNKDQVTGYQISYSYKKNFKGQKVKTLKKFKYKKIKVKRKKYTITSYKVKGLKRKKTIYVRVRAYKQVGKTKVYGKWSSVKKVKIK